MTTTPHLFLPMLEASQAQKEVTVNESLMRLDALLYTGALTYGLQVPVANPQTGDIHLIGDNPTGEWQGYAYHVAYFDQIWRYIQPRIGAALWVESAQRMMRYTVLGWQAMTSPQHIPATSMQPAMQNGCSPLATVALGADKPDITTLNFPSSGTSYAQALLLLPQLLTGNTLRVGCHWSHANAQTNANAKVRCEIQTVNAMDGQPIDVSYGVASAATSTGGQAQHYYTTSFADIAVTNEATALWLRIGRTPSHIDDTLPEAMRLHGISVNTV